MTNEIDLARIVAAAKHYELFMQAVGLPTDTPDTKDTPMRVARMFAEEFALAYREHDFKMTTFPFHGDLYVAVHKVPIRTICAHHHLPVMGHIDIVYHPDKQVIGLSKIPRLVRHLSSKPTSQEALTEEIAEHIYGFTFCRGIYVKMRATHTCMTIRGVETDGITTTAAIRGQIDKQECMRLMSEGC
jgi:GTP cyclohydrolase I